MQTFLSDIFDGTLVVETDASGNVEESVWGGEVREACAFCAGGLTVEETLAVPGADAGKTCGGLVEATSKLEQGSEACKWALYGENTCCPGTGVPSWPRGNDSGEKEGGEEHHDYEEDLTEEAEPAPLAAFVDSLEVESEPSATSKTSIAFSATFSVILALAYHTHGL